MRASSCRPLDLVVSQPRPTTPRGRTMRHDKFQPHWNLASHPALHHRGLFHRLVRNSAFLRSLRQGGLGCYADMTASRKPPTKESSALLSCMRDSERSVIGVFFRSFFFFCVFSTYVHVFFFPGRRAREYGRARVVGSQRGPLIFVADGEPLPARSVPDQHHLSRRQ